MLLRVIAIVAIVALSVGQEQPSRDEHGSDAGPTDDASMPESSQLRQEVAEQHPSSPSGDSGQQRRLQNVKPRVRAWLKKPATRSALLLVAGGMSGAVAKTITAPLERVKVMSQAGDTSNFLSLMSDVIKVEGWAGLWRGNPANVRRRGSCRHQSRPSCSALHRDGSC